MRVRRAKLDRLRESGIDPYPVTVERTTTLAEVRAAHPDLPPDTMTGEKVGVTGRVIFFRNTGKLCFATLREGDAELQVMLSRDRVGEESLAAWKADIDLGDHVLVTGEVGHVAPRRTVGLRRFLAADRQGTAPAAGGAQADERGTARPAPLRRPDRAGRGAPHRPSTGDGDVHAARTV